jgi:hypothetical protein
MKPHLESAPSCSDIIHAVWYMPGCNSTNWWG